MVYSMNRGYEYLEHTADLKIRSWGDTLEEAFSNTLYAIIDFMTDRETVVRRVEKTIQLKACDLPALLYLWLEEFLFLMDSEFYIPNVVNKIEIDKLSKGYTLKATVSGDSNTNNRYTLDAGIKAVTYNEMTIEKKDDKSVITTVLDI